MKSKGFLVSFFLIAVFFAHAQTLSSKAKKVQKCSLENTVIAHRGSIYWTPELTEAAFRWARNAGTDYLEFDVHRSRDGVLIVNHDRTFNRTTDVAQKFPGREKDYIEKFTFNEIMQLDAGSTFNKNSPGQARQSFNGLNVLVFEDVFRIAEGKRIKRNLNGSRAFHKDAAGKYVFEYEQDPADNGNRPGVYIETKYPEYYPGLEEQIYEELARFGWNPLEGKKIKDKAFYKNGKVNIGNTKGKILLQTFSRIGMENFNRIFKGDVLTSFLVSSPKSDAQGRREAMDEIVSFTVKVGAQFIGTNLGKGSKGLSPEFSEKIHTAGLRVNVYSFNTINQMEKYFGAGKGKKASPLLDGMITNRSDLTIEFYHEHGVRKLNLNQSPEQVLIELGYPI